MMNKNQIRNPKSEIRNGFTLMELLVVIAIIGMLAAILTPTINVARERGRRAVCVGNLKVIGEAFNMYNIDRGEMPPTDASNNATNQIKINSPLEIIGLGYFYDDPNFPSNIKNDYIEDFAAFVCPASSDGDLRNSQTVKQNWNNNADTFSAYIYRAESGYTAAPPAQQATLMISDAKPAIVMDYNDITVSPSQYNHKGEYVNILFRNGNVKGVENTDITTSVQDKDGRLTLGGDADDFDELFEDGADSYQ